MDRRYVLIGTVLVAMFIAVSFDPFHLSNKYKQESIVGASSTTGLFSASNIYLSVLPGLFFLAIISLFYFAAKDQLGKE